MVHEVQSPQNRFDDGAEGPPFHPTPRGQTCDSDCFNSPGILETIRVIANQLVNLKGDQGPGGDRVGGQRPVGADRARQGLRGLRQRGGELCTLLLHGNIWMGRG